MGCRSPAYRHFEVQPPRASRPRPRLSITFSILERLVATGVYPSPAMRIGLSEMVRTLGDIVARDIAPCYDDALISFEGELHRTVEDVVARISTGPPAP